MTTPQKKCHTCGGIWFWSDFTAGALKCIECVPPPQKPKRGPGIIQPDGWLLTAEAVTQHIEDTNRRAALTRIVKDLGEGWSLIKRPGLIISTHEPIVPAQVPCMRDVPDDMMIRPGDPMWVDNEVVERAIEKHRRAEQTSVGRVEGVKADVRGSQAKRAARNPPRSAGKGD